MSLLATGTAARAVDTSPLAMGTTALAVDASPRTMGTTALAVGARPLRLFVHPHVDFSLRNAESAIGAGVSI